MKAIIGACCFFLFGISSFGQNLVVNPGFEEHGEIYGNGAGSDNMRGNHVKGWYSPTGGSPDYFIRKNVELYTPYGLPQSHSGAAMAGITVFGGLEEYREYVTGELTSPLVAGVTYNFSMALALAGLSGKMVNSFGICFTHDRILAKETGSALKFIPQLIIDSTDQDSLIGKWMIFKGSYTAIGGEKYLTIGNFNRDKKTKGKVVNQGKGEPYAYYYLDDISLLPEGAEEIVDSTEIEIINIIKRPVMEIEAGKTLVVDNVYFETDKSILKEESFPVLNEIIAAMIDQPNLKVEIDGHTDAQGSKEHNQKLSEDRAKAVAAYFIAHGITADRIATKGFGMEKPIADENTEEGRKKNRRVEFVFLE
jgi:OOP family OmpA-OmpF porin